MSTGYDVDRDGLVQLLISRHFPERSGYEDRVLAEWVKARGLDFDRWSFSVRVGAGVPPDPSHDAGVQQSTAWSSRKRIDVLVWKGDQPYIGEVKYRLVPAALGQLQTYKHLWMEENPDAREPLLFAIAAYSDDDTRRVLNANGVDVYVYPDAIVSGGAPSGGVPPDNG